MPTAQEKLPAVVGSLLEYVTPAAQVCPRCRQGDGYLVHDAHGVTPRDLVQCHGCGAVWTLDPPSTPEPTRKV